MNQQNTPSTSGNDQQAATSSAPGENMPGNLPGNNAPATPSPRGATSTGTNVPAANAQQQQEALQQNQRGAGAPAQPVNTPTSTGSAGTQASQSSQSQLDAEAQAAINPNPGNLSTNSPDLARCPVCGNVVEKANAADTLPASVNAPQEQTLYFDTANCKAIYEQNPARYGSQR